jgi:hypothetical protein
MTAPATLLPAGVAGVAGAALAYKEHDSTEETIVLAGSTAAVGLGAALIYEEQNYWAGGLLLLVGGATALMLLRR